MDMQSVQQRYHSFVKLLKKDTMKRLNESTRYKQLAQNGFYAVCKIDDMLKIRCFSCKFMHNLYSLDDLSQIEDMHIQLPCLYVKGYCVSNEKVIYGPIKKLSLSERFVHMRFNIVSVRESTFPVEKWPKDLPTAKQLSIEGFVYIPNSVAKVFCFGCNLNMDLEADKLNTIDKIRTAHKISNPGCIYMALQKEPVNENDTDCIICQDGKTNLKYIPCNHVISCYICTPVLANCPVCREKITNVVTISTETNTNMTETNTNSN